LFIVDVLAAVDALVCCHLSCFSGCFWQNNLLSGVLFYFCVFCPYAWCCGKVIFSNRQW